MMGSRRAFVIAASGAATLATQVRAGTPMFEKFDVADSKDNLVGLVKVMGDLTGKPCWMLGGGRIYGLVEGEMPIPLFGVEGIRYVKFTPEGDRYRMAVRDWGYYTDLASGDMLREFQNPYTGEVNKPKPLLTKYFSWTMGTDGQNMEGYSGDAWLMGRPLRMPWSFSGNQATLTLELLVKYGNGGAGGEWVNMHASTGDVIDPTVKNVEMRYAWTGHSPWSRWMDMGKRPGRTLWNSNGRKASNLDELSPKVRGTIDAAFPGSLDNPETYEKTGGLTSTDE